MTNKSTLSQVEALIAQAAAVKKYQECGEPQYADEAASLALISRTEIGPNGELIPKGAWVTSFYTENTGGGSMADILHMDGQRVIVISDEALAIYPDREAFYGGDDAQHALWFNAPATE